NAAGLTTTGSTDIFRSPSEICNLYLIPNDTVYNSFYGYTNAPGYSLTGSTMRAYWGDHALTGDNSRERPYADIYPRLTTKSNTYTVHFRVQVLKQVPRGDSNQWSQWDESRDVVLSEYRGSQTIERYVDPSDPALLNVDYADPNVTDTIDNHYK